MKHSYQGTFTTETGQASPEGLTKHNAHYIPRKFHDVNCGKSKLCERQVSVLIMLILY